MLAEEVPPDEDPVEELLAEPEELFVELELLSEVPLDPPELVPALPELELEAPELDRLSFR